MYPIRLHDVDWTEWMDRTGFVSPLSHDGLIYLIDNINPDHLFQMLIDAFYDPLEESTHVLIIHSMNDKHVITFKSFHTFDRTRSIRTIDKERPSRYLTYKMNYWITGEELKNMIVISMMQGL